MRHDLFVSFCTADQPLADLLVQHLTQRGGWSVWQCTRPQDNPAGTDWTTTLDTKLTEALAMVLVYSARTSESEYVHREIELAVRLRRPIVPIRIDDAAWAPGVNYLMSTIQALSSTREAFADCLPMVHEAVTRALPPTVAIPLDSLADRRLKVDVAWHLAERAATGGGTVRLRGVGVALTGLPALFVQSPCLALRAWEALGTALRQAASWVPDRHTGLLPVLSKEDVVLLLHIAPSSAPVPLADACLAHACHALDHALGTWRIVPACTRPAELKVDPEVADTREALASFLTELGGNIKATDNAWRENTAPAAANADTAALKGVLRTLVRQPRTPPAALPKCLTGAAAVDHLVNILRHRGS